MFVAGYVVFPDGLDEGVINTYGVFRSRELADAAVEAALDLARAAGVDEVGVARLRNYQFVLETTLGVEEESVG